MFKTVDFINLHGILSLPSKTIVERADVCSQVIFGEVNVKGQMNQNFEFSLFRPTC